MPIHIIKNKRFLTAVVAKGIALQGTEMARQDRSESDNTQMSYKKFKDNIIKVARRIAREDTPKILRAIARLEKDKKAALNSQERSEKDTLTEASILEIKIADLKKLRHNTARLNV